VGYRRRFRKDYDSKYGLRMWHRDFFDAEIVDCPDPSVIGKSFGQIGIDRGGLHPVDAFLDLVVEHGTALRWRTTISNHRPEVLGRQRTGSFLRANTTTPASCSHDQEAMTALAMSSAS
jgi:N-acyl-D-aspartate/D-glutamate deacylase